MLHAVQQKMYLEQIPADLSLRFESNFAMKVESLALGNFDSSSKMENSPNGLVKRCEFFIAVNNP